MKGTGVHAYSDEEYLRMTFSLARKGEGETSPNPIVGALVVSEGMIVGSGFHRRAGSRHAEIVALDEAGTAARGATLYLNLEPCCHAGRTPPCTGRILRAGIKRVVCPMTDPNPLVDGRGFAELRASGLLIEEGLLKEEAARLNEVFVKYIRTGRPFVIAKAAMTLNGKISVAKGESRWISSQESRMYVHNRIRFCTDAIMVGIDTVLIDDPLLTVRGRSGRKKKAVRVVLDSFLRIPNGSKVLTTLDEGEVWIYTTAGGEDISRKRLEGTGARVITVSEERGQCSIREVIEDLGRRGITSVLIEGGSRILASAFRDRMIDKAIFFIAPKIAGDSGSSEAGGDAILTRLNGSVLFSKIDAVPIDEDIMYSAYPKYA